MTNTNSISHPSFYVIHLFFRFWVKQPMYWYYDCVFFCASVHDFDQKEGYQEESVSDLDVDWTIESHF